MVDDFNTKPSSNKLLRLFPNFVSEKKRDIRIESVLNEVTEICLNKWRLNTFILNIVWGLKTGLYILKTR